MAKLLSRVSILAFVLLVLGFTINAIGIPHHFTVRPADLEPYEPDHNYTLIDTPRRLRMAPRWLDVMSNPTLAITWRGSAQVFEDGVPLQDQDVVDPGLGFYTYRPDALRFAASDNSDPRTNGRTYVVVCHLGFKWEILAWLAVAFVVLRALLVMAERPKSAVAWR